MKNLLLLLAFGVFVISSCKEKTPDPDNDNQKTLTKSQLYDKEWFSETGHTHFFHANGQYESQGTWKWLNDSDSMEIIGYQGATPTVWRFIWTDEHEMMCIGYSSSTELLYKDHEW